ncbi:MAG: hypothetical protein IJF17_10555 [Thermoguttaceae bacterium]|nr:hypothetical protein [Thermoguttaceae bacterium]
MMRRLPTQISYRLLPTFFIALTAFILAAPAHVRCEEDVYSLISQRKAGDVDIVEKKFDAAGSLLVELDPQTHASVSSPGREEKNKQADEKKNPENQEQTNSKPLIQKIPMKVSSTQKYEEIFIQEGNLLHGENAKSTLGAWYFLENNTNIKIENTESKPVLDLNQPLIGVDIKNTLINFFRPDGFLERSELDVINVQGNTLLVDYILPKRKVKIGESWKQSPDTMGMLLQMDLVFNLDIQTTLTEVKKNIAILDTAGWIEGSYEGNTSKIDVTGKAYFDLNRGRIVWFGLVIQEKRTAGFIAPGMDVTAKVQYQIKPLTTSEKLNDQTVSKITFDETKYGMILCRDPGKAWKVVMTTDWEPLSMNEYQSSFRLLREGELVAQCSIAKIQNTKGTLGLKPEDYAQNIKEMLKDGFDSILDIKTMKIDEETEAVRVDVAAKYENLPLRMIYYLITRKGTKPVQYTMVFTLEEDLLEKFANANEPVIQSFSWEK